MQDLVDLKYAFTSKEEAEAAGGSEVEELWHQAQAGAKDLPSCWQVLMAKRVGLRGNKEVVQPKPVVRWKGLSAKASVGAPVV